MIKVRTERDKGPKGFVSFNLSKPLSPSSSHFVVFYIHCKCSSHKNFTSFFGCFNTVKTCYIVPRIYYSIFFGYKKDSR